MSIFQHYMRYSSLHLHKGNEFKLVSHIFRTTHTVYCPIRPRVFELVKYSFCLVYKIQSVWNLDSYLRSLQSLNGDILLSLQ